jgi:hypothetical protein
VCLFFRRIGLSRYLKCIRDYGVDGRVLCNLDDEDYENMDIKNKIHIRKIKLELMRFYDFKRNRVLMSDAHAKRYIDVTGLDLSMIRQLFRFEMSRVISDDQFIRRKNL